MKTKISLEMAPWNGPIDQDHDSSRPFVEPWAQSSTNAIFRFYCAEGNKAKPVFKDGKHRISILFCPYIL
jgi:hypothetical protein